MTDKIVIPDAAIRQFNEKYGHLLPKVKKPSSIPDYLDEDKLYEQYLLLNKNSE